MKKLLIEHCEQCPSLFVDEEGIRFDRCCRTGDEKTTAPFTGVLDSCPLEDEEDK